MGPLLSGGDLAGSTIQGKIARERLNTFRVGAPGMPALGICAVDIADGRTVPSTVLRVMTTSGLEPATAPC